MKKNEFKYLVMGEDIPIRENFRGLPIFAVFHSQYESAKIKTAKYFPISVKELSLDGASIFAAVTSLANQFRKENADVVGDKPVKNDTRPMSMSDDSKQQAWLEHYQRLLNAEFDWDPNHLSDESPVEGPPIPITVDMVKKAISQMKAGKALGPSGYSSDD